MAYECLKQVEEKLGAKIAYSEKVSPSEIESIIRGYAAEGFYIIISHGFQFGDPASKVAKQFSEVNFIITSSNITQKPNLSSVQIDDT